VLVSRSGTQTGEEGCLSIPGVWQDVTRALEVTVDAVDQTGKPFRIEAGGYLARVLQHEMDHLDGVLFVERLSMLKRQFLRRELDRIARGELPEDHRPVASGDGR
jgi:peptide deformylase